jgi:hypothetical protein
MITVEEQSELVQMARADGKRFYDVAEGIYKFLTEANWVTGVAGVLLAIVVMVAGKREFGFVAGVIVLAGTALVCAGNYVVAVLATHGAKVLVHILFSNIAIMEGGQA